LLLLLFGAVLPDGEHRQRALDAHQRTEAGVPGLELHAGQTVRGGARAGAAVALEVHPEHAERAELLGQLTDGDAGCLVPVGDLWTDPGVDEAPHRVADRTVLLADQGVGPE